jgi:uncharacterized protein YndB with AHSA1/START domain
LNGAKLQIVRQFRAPPDVVFSACTDPAIMARWLGPKDWTVVALHADVRTDGRFWFRMVGPSGVLAAEGIYEIVEPPTRLVHSWRWAEGSVEHPADGTVSRVTYHIEPLGSGTRLTFTHEGLKDREGADSHSRGWSDALDKLAEAIDERPAGEALA